MKKFTDLVKENAKAKTYKYDVTAKFTGKLNAENEGAAGEMIDKKIDSMFADTTDFSYEIGNIEATNDNVQENIDNDEVLDHTDPGATDCAMEVSEKLKNVIDENFFTHGDLSSEETTYVINDLIKHLNETKQHLSDDINGSENPTDDFGSADDHINSEIKDNE